MYAPPPHAQEFFFGTQLLDASVASIDHVQVAGSVCGKRIRLTEGTSDWAVKEFLHSHGAQEVPPRAESLNRQPEHTARIAYVHITVGRVDGDAGWALEAAFIFSMWLAFYAAGRAYLEFEFAVLDPPTPGPHEVAVRFELVHAAIAGVCNVYISSAGISAQASAAAAATAHLRARKRLAAGSYRQSAAYARDACSAVLWVCSRPVVDACLPLGVELMKWVLRADVLSCHVS